MRPIKAVVSRLSSPWCLLLVQARPFLLMPLCGPPNPTVSRQFPAFPTPRRCDTVCDPLQPLAEIGGSSLSEKAIKGFVKSFLLNQPQTTEARYTMAGMENSDKRVEITTVSTA